MISSVHYVTRFLPKTVQTRFAYCTLTFLWGSPMILNQLAWLNKLLEIEQISNCEGKRGSQPSFHAAVYYYQSIVLKHSDCAWQFHNIMHATRYISCEGQQAVRWKLYKVILAWKAWGKVSLLKKMSSYVPCIVIMAELSTSF